MSPSSAQPRLRILILCNRITYPPNDGGSIGAYQVAKGLADEGNTVSMLAFNTRKHYVDTSTLAEEFSSRIHLQAMDVNSDVTTWGAIKNLFSRQCYQVARFDVPAFRTMLEQHLQQNEYDVIHLEGIHMAVYMDTLRHYSKAVIVLRSPNVEHQLWQTVAQGEKNILKKWYLLLQAARYKNFEDKTAAAVDALITVIPEDRNYFLKCIAPERCLLAPTGIESSTYAPRGLERQKNTVFHLGDLAWIPNRQAVEWFIEKVWAKVQKQAPELSFSVVGRNIPREYYQDEEVETSYYDTYIVGKNINVMGDVADAYDYMQGNAVMIVPLFAGGGMRVKIIDGMASGNVIVTTPLGVQGILARHDEHLLVASTAEEFAAAIIRAAREEGLANRLRRNALRLIQEEYDAATINKRIANFYRELVKEHGQNGTQNTMP